MCYIETKSLDGETNLKQRAAIREISQHFQDHFEKRVTLHFEPPNPNLDRFTGTCYLGNDESA